MAESLRNGRGSVKGPSSLRVGDTFYPLYSLAGERVRTAFRIAYSQLDKVGFLVDRYWALGKVPDRIS